MKIPAYAYLYLFFLYSLFAITLGLAVYYRRLLKPIVTELPKDALLLLAGLILLCAYLRLFVMPHHVKVYFDEFNFLNIAQNIYYHNAYGMTAIGDKVHLEGITGFSRPGGWPLLLSIFFRIFGPSPQAAFLTNALLGSLSVAVVFLSAYLLFKKPSLAFFCGFVACFYPPHLKYSSNASADMASFLFLSLAFLILLLFIDKKQRGLLFLLAAILLCASYIKPENSIFLFLLAAGVIWKKIFPAKKLFDWLYFLLALSVPLVKQLFAIIKTEGHNARGSFWSLRHLWQHIPANMDYFWDYRYTPTLVLILALLGMPFVHRFNKRTFYYLTLYLAGALLICSGYFAGIFFAEERYFLPFTMPFFIFAGAGLYAIVGFFHHKGYGRIVMPILLTAVMLNGFYVAGTFCALTSTHQGEALSPPEQEVYYLKRTLAPLDGQAYFITSAPAVLLCETDKKVIVFYSFMEKRPLPDKAYVVKTGGWNEASYKDYMENLAKIYGVKTLAEHDFSNSRTVVSEIRKKQLP